MSDTSLAFKMPPQVDNSDGTPRRVGFELEFSGLNLDQTATALQQALGGRLQKQSVAKCVLQVDGLGDFSIELDWHFLKRAAEADAVQRNDDEWLAFLAEAAHLLVPVEVVCPPLPLSALEKLEAMVDALRTAGAVGTEESLLAAYGVHINTEIPALDAETLFAYLRAFGLLQWWLVDAHAVDISRRMSPYIDLYPESYLQTLLTCKAPSLQRLTADYLNDNASRNRALDLLPLLAYIDAAAVRRAVDDPKIKARPAFHYRLPNCHIERADWSLSLSWNTWWVVEQLAAHSQALEQLGADFLAADRPVIGVNRRDWVAYIEQWLHNQGWG